MSMRLVSSIVVDLLQWQYRPLPNPPILAPVFNRNHLANPPFKPLQPQLSHAATDPDKIINGAWWCLPSNNTQTNNK
jgi:hypothetical protein